MSTSEEVTNDKQHCKMANGDEESSIPPSCEEGPVEASAEASAEVPAEAPAETQATRKYICKWSNPSRSEHKNHYLKWTNPFRSEPKNYHLKWSNPLHSKHAIYHIATAISTIAFIEFIITALFYTSPPETSQTANIVWFLQYAVPVVYSAISQFVFGASSFHSKTHPVAPVVLCGCTLTIFLGLISYKFLVVSWDDTTKLSSESVIKAIENWTLMIINLVLLLPIAMGLLVLSWSGFRKEWTTEKTEGVEPESPA